MKQITRVPYPNAWPSLKWDLTSDLILDAIITRQLSAPTDTEIEAMYEDAQRRGLIASAEEEHHND